MDAIFDDMKIDFDLFVKSTDNFIDEIKEYDDYRHGLGNPDYYIDPNEEVSDGGTDPIDSKPF